MRGVLVLGEAKGHPQTIGFAEAAVRLGISEATLRTVLERGFLKGAKDAEGQWRIYLDPLSGAPVPTDGHRPQAEFTSPVSVAQSSTGKAGTNPNTSRGGDAGGGDQATCDPGASLSRDNAVTASSGSRLSPLENVLAEEIQYLRKQIERRDEAIVKKDRLIDELTRRLAKLDIVDGRLPNPGPAIDAAMGANLASRLQRPQEADADADHWHRELDRTFQELRGLLARRPQSRI
jgi:hypothetical protein